MKKIINYLASLAVVTGLCALTPQFTQADDRVLWVSIGDGIGNSANLDAAIAFADANNFNAIAILARYRADLYFTPNRDFSTYTNNEPMRTGGFDAVQYVIDRAHENDIRVYAAVSTFIVSDGGASSFPTITGLDSSWTQWVYQGGTNDSTYDPNAGFPRQMLASEGEGFWIDPAISAARDYTKDVVLDLVENYDIDGIILDRTRYPGDAIPRRNESFGYNPLALGAGNPAPGDSTFLEAKRDAVSDFVQELQAEIHAIKPWIIYGATPIAFGTSDADTLNTVYQDYVEWNTRSVSTSIRPSGAGILDVIMPQFYRSAPADNNTLIGVFQPNLSNIPLSPIFFGSSASVTGAEMGENICDTFTAGLDGYGIFAYTDTVAKIADINSYSEAGCGPNVLSADATGLTEFTNKAGWDSTPPGDITDLAGSNATFGQVDLSWSAPVDATRYLVYRDTDSTVEPYYENLLNKTTDVTSASFSDTNVVDGQTYYYLVLPVDGYNNKGGSNTSTGITAIFPEVIVESRDSGGAVTASPTYSESGSYTSTSAKSPNAALSGSGARFSTTIGDTASFSPAITESGLYDVYYIMDGGSSNSSAIANSTVTITSNEGANESFSYFITKDNPNFANGVDVFDKITATPIEVSAGAAGSAITVTFENLDGDGAGVGAGNRFVMDSVRFLYAGPLPGGDTTAPTLDSVATLTTDPTNGTSAQFTFTFSEDVQNFNDFATDVSVSGVTSSGGSIAQVNASTYTVTVTGISTDGTLTVTTAGGTDTEDLANNALAGSPASGSILIDTAAPTASIAITEDYKVTGNVNAVASNLSDGGSPITTSLYMRLNGGSWSLQGNVNVANFTVVALGSGVNDVYVSSVDDAGNEKPAPTDGVPEDDSFVYSAVENNYTYTPTAGTSNVLFPMTDTNLVTMDFTNATGISAVNVTRVLGNNAPTGFDAGRLIDEYLDITGTFTGTVDYSWQYSNIGTFTGTADEVYRDTGSTVDQISSGNTAFGSGIVTISNVTGFSDWYIGDASASEADWMILDN